MRPIEQFVPVPGGRIFTLQWGEGPLLVFTHATGMCARVYSQLLAPLGHRFRIVALDARGHGRTELEAVPGHIPADWTLYRQDLVGKGSIKFFQIPDIAIDVRLLACPLGRDIYIDISGKNLVATP